MHPGWPCVERAHPDDCPFQFRRFGVLLQQIARGAPVDLFASADQATMDDAGQQGLIRSDSRRNLRNAGAGGTGRSDLVVQRLPTWRPRCSVLPSAATMSRPALAESLENAGVWSTLEDRIVPTQNVRQTLDYVVRGEVDAGVVSTDAQLWPTN